MAYTKICSRIAIKISGTYKDNKEAKRRQIENNRNIFKRLIMLIHTNEEREKKKIEVYVIGFLLLDGR